MRFLYLFLSIAFNVASYTVYKSIAQKQHTVFWYLLFSIGLVFGAANVLFFTKSLESIHLNVAYPVFSGACILSIAILSNLVFGEKLGIMHMAGAALVIIGITLLTAGG